MEEIVLENNALSLPSGMMDYGQAATSWNQYAVDNNLTPEQTQAGLDKLAKGDLPEGANIAKVIVDGYVDGVMIAGSIYLGPAAAAGKATAGALISGGGNATFQILNMKPGGEFSYYSAFAATTTGYLAPGCGIWANTVINMGSAFATDGPNAGAVGGAAIGSLAGGAFGKYAPVGIDNIFGNNLPGFVYDAGGAFTFEYINSVTKEMMTNGDKK
jgi:filamentous hemagglutinin